MEWMFGNCNSKLFQNLENKKNGAGILQQILVTSALGGMPGYRGLH